jgi:hypothetical protein
MYIISIDIGFEHFAIIGANVSGEYQSEQPEQSLALPYKLEDITLCKLINIKNLMLECSDTDCKLKHTLCISDYMAHLFKTYHDFFEKADTIIIERQPPQGFVAVQELILFKYREKALLVSPNSMHKHFSMSKVQKLRKMFTEKFSKERLQSFPDYSNNERKHDMGDAYCLLVYYLSKLRSDVYLKVALQPKAPKITSRYFTGGEATQSATNFSQFIYKHEPIRLKNLLYTVQDRD